MSLLFQSNEHKNNTIQELKKPIMTINDRDTDKQAHFTQLAINK